MKLRMTMATGLVAVALTVLSGCGKSDGNTPEPSPNAGTSSSATATPDTPTPSAALDLTGNWHDEAAQWTVHFHKDGTFVEDFQGVTDFRVGRYKLVGDTVSLIGDDGNTDKGTVTGDALVFRLGTLTKI
ncbi:MAG: hypothetical protein JWR83_2351 [Aeromicrobium sp.]|nr:hypothetical protein [Aeromicrobium sp.]